MHPFGAEYHVSFLDFCTSDIVDDKNDSDFLTPDRQVTYARFSRMSMLVLNQSTFISLLKELSNNSAGTRNLGVTHVLDATIYSSNAVDGKLRVSSGWCLCTDSGQALFVHSLISQTCVSFSARFTIGSPFPCRMFFLFHFLNCWRLKRWLGHHGSFQSTDSFSIWSICSTKVLLIGPVHISPGQSPPSVVCCRKSAKHLIRRRRLGSGQISVLKMLASNETMPLNA